LLLPEFFTPPFHPVTQDGQKKAPGGGAFRGGCVG